MKKNTGILMIIVSIALLSACNGKTTNDNSFGDSTSVKKMTADSNSDIPVHSPTDSLEKMPNSLDSSK